ncbi:MAG TPA: hypothetical protein VF623_10070 [Segetibacter sp.]|jgi:hypothetical protein
MKKIIALLPLLLLLSLTNLYAMDHWEILLNNKVIFKGKIGEENPTLKFKSRSFKTTDRFTLKYTADDPQKDWNRIFIVTDAQDKELKTVYLDKQSVQVSVKASEVKLLMNKKQPVFIYTTSLPKDPAKAATVRVRRILLCKVEWN